MELGCGKGLTTLYLAKETDANIFAVDLWIGATENYKQFKEWWISHIGQSEHYEIIKAFELDCFDDAWKEWFASKHPYAIHDEKYFAKGVDKYLSTVGLIIRKK